MPVARTTDISGGTMSSNILQQAQGIDLRMKQPMATATALDGLLNHGMVLELDVKSYWPEQGGKTRNKDNWSPEIRRPIGVTPELVYQVKTMLSKNAEKKCGQRELIIDARHRRLL
jgi:hypothetical protein